MNSRLLSQKGSSIPNKKSASSVSGSTSPQENISFKVGEKVYLSSVKKSATVKYIGKAHFASGTWIGLELPDPSGKNNGSVLGQKYFTCKPMYGIFVRPALCHPIPNTKSISGGHIHHLPVQPIPVQQDGDNPNGIESTARMSTPSLKSNQFSNDVTFTPPAPSFVKSTSSIAPPSPSSSFTRPILRKSSDELIMSPSPSNSSKTKSVVWSDTIEDRPIIRMVPSTNENLNRTGNGFSSLQPPSINAGSNTENLIGRIDSALTKSASSPYPRQSPETSISIRSSSSSSGVKRQGGPSSLATPGRPSATPSTPRSTTPSKTSKPAISSKSPGVAQRSCRNSIGGTSGSTVGIGGAPSLAAPTKYPDSAGKLVRDIVSDELLLRQFTSAVVAQMSSMSLSDEFEEIDRWVQIFQITMDLSALLRDSLLSQSLTSDPVSHFRLVSGSVQRLQSNDSLPSIEAVLAVNRRVDGLEDVLASISDRVDGVIVSVETFLDPLRRQTLNGEQLQAQPPAKELESQVAHLKQALAGVAQLTKQAMEATMRERQEHSQHVAKLEMRLRRLELGDDENRLSPN